MFNVLKGVLFNIVKSQWDCYLAEDGVEIGSGGSIYIILLPFIELFVINIKALECIERHDTFMHVTVTTTLHIFLKHDTINK